MKISIFGVGYVGIVTGCCLAEMGNDILFVDIDTERIESLRKGISPIYEPGLDLLVNKNMKTGRMQFTTDAEEGIKFGTVIFSAVGTLKAGKTDLSGIYEIAKKFGKYIDTYKIMVNKSTVPAGTGSICFDIIAEEIKKGNKNIKFDIVSNPEFLREGSAILDFMEPDRIIYGASSKKSRDIMREIYAPFKKKGINIIETDIKTAEVIKYISNIFLGLKISFINEIANFSEIIGVNINDIREGIGSDKRIGMEFLRAGIGYGGSCFSKDIKEFIKQGKKYDYNFKILPNIELVNEKQKLVIVDKLLTHLDLKKLNGKTISIWGLSYKENTDDIRFSPSIDIIERLLSLGVEEIRVFDPAANKNMQRMHKKEEKIIFCDEKFHALKDTHGLLLLTPWKDFRNLDYEIMKNNMRNKLIIDGRNFLNKRDLRKNGFTYIGIGVT